MSPEDQVLSETISDVLDVVASQALHHYDNDNLTDASAIINEWTTSSGESILTHFYTDTLESVTDDLLYFINNGDQIGYGTFTFSPETELPIDQWHWLKHKSKH